LIAIVNQGRANAEKPLPPLDGATQTLPALYSLPYADFNDITIGTNGSFDAQPGYDEVTGLGTPNAKLLVPALVAWNQTDVTAQVSAAKSGLVYNRATQLFGGSITLTYTGTTTIVGTFEFVLSGLPAGVTLANSSGYTTDGDSYILISLPNGILLPGQSVTFTVFFANPNRSSFTYGIMALDMGSSS
jgi:hypothetical protein